MKNKQIEGYILNDPDFVPIAKRCWTGSNATDVGSYGKPYLTVCNEEKKPNKNQYEARLIHTHFSKIYQLS